MHRLDHAAVGLGRISADFSANHDPLSADPIRGRNLSRDTGFLVLRCISVYLYARKTAFMRRKTRFLWDCKYRRHHLVMGRADRPMTVLPLVVTMHHAAGRPFKARRVDRGENDGRFGGFILRVPTSRPSFCMHRVRVRRSYSRV